MQVRISNARDGVRYTSIPRWATSFRFSSMRKCSRAFSLRIRRATETAFAEIIIDNPAATYTGVWTTSTSGTDKYGADYKYGSTVVTEGKTATWRPTIQYAGNYNVYIWYSVGSNRATNAPCTTHWDGGNATVNANQTVSGGQWVLLQSSKHFAAGTAGYVKLGNGTGATGKVVIADAVRFVQVTGD